MTDEEFVAKWGKVPSELGYIYGGVAPGWNLLIHELLSKLNELPDWDNKYIAQVKQKFGGLRFYVDFHSDEIDSLILKAEGRSFLTCETCGAVGERRSRHGWIYTACDQHVR